jgi:hypothetical protein
MPSVGETCIQFEKDHKVVFCQSEFIGLFPNKMFSKTDLLIV